MVFAPVTSLELSTERQQTGQDVLLTLARVLVIFVMSQHPNNQNALARNFQRKWVWFGANVPRMRRRLSFKMFKAAPAPRAHLFSCGDCEACLPSTRPVCVCARACAIHARVRFTRKSCSMPGEAFHV